MKINVILEYFDKLNDNNAMFIEFTNGGQLLVDNEDVIRGDDELMEIRATTGTYVTSPKCVVGLKIANRVDIMQKAMLGEIIGKMGE